MNSQALVTKFTCPADGCGAQWIYPVVRMVGNLTQQQLKTFECKLSENYMAREMEVVACPRCKSRISRSADRCKTKKNTKKKYKTGEQHWTKQKQSKKLNEEKKISHSSPSLPPLFFFSKKVLVFFYQNDRKKNISGTADSLWPLPFAWRRAILILLEVPVKKTWV